MADLARKQRQKPTAQPSRRREKDAYSKHISWLDRRAVCATTYVKRLSRIRLAQPQPIPCRHVGIAAGTAMVRRSITPMRDQPKWITVYRLWNSEFRTETPGSAAREVGVASVRVCARAWFAATYDLRGSGSTMAFIEGAMQSPKDISGLGNGAPRPSRRLENVALSRRQRGTRRGGDGRHPNGDSSVALQR